MSELVRAAVDAWLDRQGEPTDEVSGTAPVFHCGEIRDAAYDDRIRP